MTLAELICGGAFALGLLGFILLSRPGLGFYRYLVLPLSVFIFGLLYVLTVDRNAFAIFPFAGLAVSLLWLKWLRNSSSSSVT